MVGEGRLPTTVHITFFTVQYFNTYDMEVGGRLFEEEFLTILSRFLCF
jgi:hypothetical protein